MGVRLYPRTRNPESLEKLAGAVPGTHLRLELLRQEHGVDDPNRDFWSLQDAYEAFHEAVHADPDLARLDGFLTFGWGKFRDPGVAPGYTGLLTDRRAMSVLLSANWLSGACVAQATPGLGFEEVLALSEGLVWN